MVWKEKALNCKCASKVPYIALGCGKVLQMDVFIYEGLS